MLLSICIPTKNRALVLQQSLQSIVSQDIFKEREDIEIVVCDNASDDNTADITQEFANKFMGRIRYHRNSTDIEDANVEQALLHGQGQFLKLANDSLSWIPGSIEKMIRLVEMTMPLKPILFFLNQSKPTEEVITEVSDIDSFLKIVSFYITWIGSFGIWKTQLDQISDFSRHAKLKLPQVDVILRQMSITKTAYVCNLPMFQVISTGPKGGYNIAEVFGTNYLAILRQFQDQIPDASMSALKKEVLEQHILPFYCSDAHNFGQIDIEKWLPDYVHEDYFAPLLARAKVHKEKVAREKFHQDAPLIWRQRNSHNQTVIRNLFDFDKVKVGQATYGPLNIHEWGHPDEQLNIGHYVSISEGVTFLLGGNHPHQVITTFPVKVKFLGHPKEAQTKGAINVGDDVWLGHNAMIMSGVSISQGAVVAAGSVVTRDVPAYAIVAGNPARIIKYRFPDSTIQELLKINYALISPECLAEIGLNLYQTVETPEFASSLTKLIKISTDKVSA
jgi:acetyltransferase-like isoleucine patch superfamily enzyme